MPRPRDRPTISPTPIAPVSPRATGARVLGLALLLVAAVVVVYHRVGSHQFVNLDDDAYVEFNPMVNQGLRPAAVAWAFRAAHSGMWHPLTSLSHILDCEFFGVRAGPMHWENVLWHALNAGLVFFLWHRLTGAVWRPALVAALFALHPLNVESVAWISERKNLLSTFCWLLGLLAYASYARQPTRGRYLLVVLGMVGALLSKPMAVTFPAVLLLLDYWPLQRSPARPWRRLFLEKLPLFALSVAHSLVTVLTQHAVGAEAYGARFGWWERLANALVSYPRYIGKLLWPHPLAPFYPHPGQWPLLAIGGAAALLFALSWFAWRVRSRHPWALFGWLWFLGTLVPVIGLVQVGAQSIADRYAYFTALGLFTVVAWAAGEAARQQTAARGTLVLAVGGALAVGGWLTARQVAAWSDSVALYQRSIAAGEDNSTLRYLLGVTLAAKGAPAIEVESQFRRAIALQPDYVNAHIQLASLALRRQQPDEAARLIQETLRLDPRRVAEGCKSLAAIKKTAGLLADAEKLYQQAIELKPDFADAHQELARLLSESGRIPEAHPHFARVVLLRPWDAVATCELAAADAHLGRFADARRLLERGRWLDPRYAPAREGLAALAQLEARQRAATGGVTPRPTP
ncbi:MAG: tetratricopeptide repeat protein [Verrucomicrobia bacterium]|nr:tetratricopeptide repeat protein [Verrucomicrobiota bacterium]